MTRTLVPPLAALLLAWPAASAAGPWVKGYESVPDWRSSKNNGRPFEAEFVHGWAECIVARWAEDAQALLETMPESPAQGEVISRLEVGECLYSGRAAVYAFALRGAIAERFLKAPSRSFKSPFGRDETYASFTDKIRAASRRDDDSFETRRSRIGRWVGYCAVQKNEPAAAAVLRTRPSSKQEITALMGLVPTFAACLPPTRRLFASVPEMRTLLAEPLYWRRAVEEAPRGNSRSDCCHERLSETQASSLEAAE